MNHDNNVINGICCDVENCVYNNGSCCCTAKEIHVKNRSAESGETMCRDVLRSLTQIFLTRSTEHSSRAPTKRRTTGVCHTRKHRCRHCLSRPGLHRLHPGSLCFLVPAHQPRSAALLL